MGSRIDDDADYKRCKFYVVRGYHPEEIHRIYRRWYGAASPSLSTIKRWRLQILRNAGSKWTGEAVKRYRNGDRSSKPDARDAALRLWSSKRYKTIAELHRKLTARGYGELGYSVSETTVRKWIRKADLKTANTAKQE